MSEHTNGPGDEVPPPADIRQIRVADIYIDDSFDSSKKHVVANLAESFKEVGVIHPPTVYIKEPVGKNFGKETFQLVAGLHRVQAAMSLGWEFIDVIVVEHVKPLNRKRQITENLHRKRLTKIERGELVAEWIKLRKEERGQLAPTHSPDKGIKAASKKFATASKSIRRSLAAANLHPEAKKALRDAGLDDNGSVIAEVAKATREDQVAMVDEIVRARAHEAERKRKKKPETVSPPTQPADDNDDWSCSAFDDLKEAWEKSPAMKRAWESADPNDRHQFIDEVLLADESEEESAD